MHCPACCMSRCNKGRQLQKPLRYYATHGIKPIALGPHTHTHTHTPRPRRAEAAVKLFQTQTKFLADQYKISLPEDPAPKKVTFTGMPKKAVYARNRSVSYGGQTPVEIAWGHKPDDIVQLENMSHNSWPTRTA
eukprot:4215143-Karenia_brevis.AAC.1